MKKYVLKFVLGNKRINIEPIMMSKLNIFSNSIYEFIWNLLKKNIGTIYFDII